MKKSKIYTSGAFENVKNAKPLNNLKKLKNRENINYFDLVIQAKNAFFITIEEENYLIGLISLVKVSEKEWLIQSVDIAENERNKGNSKILIKEFFNFASKNIKEEIKQSSYSKMGIMYVCNVFNSVKKDYPGVKFIDNKKIGFYENEEEMKKILSFLKSE